MAKKDLIKGGMGKLVGLWNNLSEKYIACKYLKRIMKWLGILIILFCVAFTVQELFDGDTFYVRYNDVYSTLYRGAIEQDNELDKLLRQIDYKFYEKFLNINNTPIDVQLVKEMRDYVVIVTTIETGWPDQRYATYLIIFRRDQILNHAAGEYNEVEYIVGCNPKGVDFENLTVEEFNKLARKGEVHVLFSKYLDANGEPDDFGHRQMCEPFNVKDASKPDKRCKDRFRYSNLFNMYLQNIIVTQNHAKQEYANKTKAITPDKLKELFK